MSTRVQFRRGTTTQHGSFTGLSGEMTIDTDKNTVVVHDGSTQGGHPLVKEAYLGAIDTDLLPDMTGGSNGVSLHSLGSPTAMWQDVYIGPGSLYINGTKVLEESGSDIVVSADTNQNIAIQTSGSGDVEFYPTGSGVIQMKGALQIEAGKNLMSSDGNAISVSVDFDMNGEMITGLGTPSGASDVATKGYVDAIDTRVIEASDTTAALRITQTGTGHALLVEDAANPDASPFYIDHEGNCVIAGDLTVNGTTTTVNTETINLADNIIALNSNHTGAPTQDAGIKVERGSESDVYFTWDETNDVWSFGNPVDIAGDVELTGAMIVKGGFAQVILEESDAPITHNRTQIAYDSETFQFKIRDSANGLVDVGYLMNNGASGATGHTWRIGNSVAAQIVSDGKFGIGTSGTVAAELEVSRTAGNCVSMIRSSDTAYSELNFADVSSTTVSRIRYDHSSNLMRFDTNGSNAMNIVASGTLDLLGNDLYLGNSAIISSAGDGSNDDRSTDDNIDHIWHDDNSDASMLTTGTWNFCSDSTYKAAGNSKIAAGGLRLVAPEDATNTLHITAVNTDASVGRQAAFIDYNLSGSQTFTGDKTNRGLYVDVDSTATGGNTTEEHRIYGIEATVSCTGDSDAVYGLKGYALAHQTSGQVTEVRGVDGYARGGNNASTDAANVKGGQFYAQWDSTYTADTCSVLGAYCKAEISAQANASNVNATGCLGEVEMEDSGTLQSAKAFNAVIDRNAGTIQTGYLFYGDFTGSLPSTRYGLYYTDNVNSYIGGTLQQGSDIRLKENVTDITNALDKVNQIRGVTFDWKHEEVNDRQMGVIAQEVEVVAPEVVSENEEGMKSVAYGNMVGLLIEAIKELKDKNEQLEQRLAAMEN